MRPSTGSAGATIASPSSAASSAATFPRSCESIFLNATEPTARTRAAAWAGGRARVLRSITTSPSAGWSAIRRTPSTAAVSTAPERSSAITRTPVEATLVGLTEHQGDYALLALGVLGASTAPPLIAACAAPALAIAFWRTGAAAVVLAPFALRARTDAPRRALLLALLAGTALAVHFGTFIPSLTYTSVASATALVCSQAVWAAVLGRILGERLPARAWLGVAVCLAGVLLITGVDVSLDARALRGDALAL